MYKLRSKVEILDLSNEFVVASFGYENIYRLKDQKTYWVLLLNIGKILSF